MDALQLLDSTTRGAGYDGMVVGGIRYLPTCMWFVLSGTMYLLLTIAYTCTVSLLHASHLPSTCSPGPITRHPYDGVGSQDRWRLFGPAVSTRDPDDPKRQAFSHLLVHDRASRHFHAATSDNSLTSRRRKAGRRTGPRLLMQAVNSLATQ
jgi:hypothetical protein